MYKMRKWITSYCFSGQQKCQPLLSQLLATLRWGQTYTTGSSFSVILISEVYRVRYNMSFYTKRENKYTPHICQTQYITLIHMHTRYTAQ